MVNLTIKWDEDSCQGERELKMSRETREGKMMKREGGGGG